MIHGPGSGNGVFHPQLAPKIKMEHIYVICFVEKQMIKIGKL